MAWLTAAAMLVPHSFVFVGFVLSAFFNGICIDYVETDNYNVFVVVAMVVEALIIVTTVRLLREVKISKMWRNITLVLFAVFGTLVEWVESLSLSLPWDSLDSGLLTLWHQPSQGCPLHVM
jgi:hypothetical protein